jgi:hypothetical protein
MTGKADVAKLLEDKAKKSDGGTSGIFYWSKQVT